MKLLAVLFLAGLGLALAVPVPSNEGVSLNDVEELDYLLSSSLFTDEKRDLKDDVLEKMRQLRDTIMEKMREYMEKGREVPDLIINKMKELRKRFPDTGEVDKKFREYLDKLPFGKVRDMFNKVMDRLGIKRDSDDDAKRDLEQVKKDLKEAYGRILNKIKEAIEKGKEVEKKTIDKLRDIREKLKEELTEMNEKARNFIGKVKEGAKEKFREILKRLGIIEKNEVAYADEQEKTDYIRKLKEKFHEVAQKIKDALDNNKRFQEALEKLKEIGRKLKDLGADIGDKGRELVSKLKEKVKEYYEKVFGKVTEKRDTKILEYLRKLRNLIKEREINTEIVREFIENKFGKSEMTDKLLDMMKTKGEQAKKRILDFLNRILGDKGDEKRSLKEVYEKVKNYFRDLKIEMKEKFSKFGEYAKEKYEKALQSGKDRVENLKKLAKEFINDARVISKDVAEQAKEFFREYRDDLGTVYDDVKEKVRDILKKD